MDCRISEFTDPTGQKGIFLRLPLSLSLYSSTQSSPVLMFPTLPCSDLTHHPCAQCYDFSSVFYRSSIFHDEQSEHLSKGHKQSMLGMLAGYVFCSNIQNVGRFGILCSMSNTLSSMNCVCCCLLVINLLRN